MPAGKGRLSRNAIRAIAWASGIVAFALPWAAFRVAPTVSASGAGGTGSSQVVVVPAGSKVVITRSAAGTARGQVIRAKGGGTSSIGAPLTTTRASAPAPIH